MSRDAIRARFWAWLALAAVVAGVFFLHLKPQMRVDTDILALLPASDRDADAEATLRRFAGQLGRRLVFLVGAEDFERARAAAVDFAAALRAGAGIAEARAELGAEVAGTPDWLDHAPLLLADADRARLARGDAAPMEREALAAIYAPAGPPRPLPVAQDPLNFAGRFLLQQVPPLPAATLRDGVLAVEDGGRHWVVVLVQTAGDAFSVDAQDAVRSALGAGRAAVAAKGAELRSSGVMLHAVAAGAQARREMALFGTVSTVGVVVLTWLAFASLRPLVLSLSVVGFGALAGLSACLVAFGSVHLLTLVFGTSLIGVAVDYSLHFFADQFRRPDRPWDGRAGLAHVGRPILVGHCCAVLGYLGLLFAPFPGLRQMALFSVCGLVAACGSVLFLYPVLARAGRRRETPLLRVARRLAKPWQPGRWALLGVIAAVAVLATGLARLQWIDDVRLLQASPQWLLQDEAEVRRLLGQGSESRFFLVRGADAQQVLEREEALRARLDAALAQRALLSYAAVTRALPSLARQREDRELLFRTAYATDGPGPRALAQLGFPAASAAALRERLARAPELTPERFFALASSAPARTLWLGEGAGAASAVMLQGIADAGAVAAAADGLPGVLFVDKLTDTTATLRRCRTAAERLTLAAYALIGAILAWRYGPRVAAWLLVPPLGGALATVALLGLVGIPANFFNLLALLLVLGMGVDYAVFLREGRAAPPPVLLAILMSTLTTLLSFGILAVSQTPFIRAVGMTLACGIGMVFLLAVLVHRTGIAARTSTD